MLPRSSLRPADDLNPWIDLHGRPAVSDWAEDAFDDFAPVHFLEGFVP